MHIVVVSDTHLSRVTKELEEVGSEFFRKADLVIHLGDWESLEIYEYFKQYPLIGVAGNADPSNLKKILPYKKQVKISGYRFGIIHGYGASFDLVRRLRPEFQNVDVILFGHTHEPYQVKESGVWWINPGSLFYGRGEVERSLLIVRLDYRIYIEMVIL